MNIDRFRTFQGSHRFSTITSAFITVLMMGCLAISSVQAINRFVPNWQGGYVVWLCMLVSAEAMWSNFNNRQNTLRERLTFHLSEWLVILLVIQFVTFARHGFTFFGEWLALLRANIFTFFHPEFMLAFGPVFVVWVLSFMTSEELASLEVEESELKMDNPEVLERDRRQIRRQMAERTMLTGLLLVFLAFVARLELVQLFGENPATRAPVYNVVAYYALALVLISQIQLSALRGHWLWTHAPIRANLASSWLKYSLVFFAIIALLAVFLPTQYTLGFLATLGYVLQIFWQAVIFVAFLILTPLMALINFLMSLFSTPGEESEPLRMDPPEILPPAGDNPVGWLELLKAILFWTVLLGITGYFLMYYLRQNRALWKQLRAFGPLRWLAGRLGLLWAWLRRVNRQVARMIQSGRRMLFPPQSPADVQSRRGLFNLRRSSPRQQIIFFYLRLIERGEEQGIRRKPSQTPLQYRQVLAQNLPDVESEVQGMTDSFIEARYTPHDISADQAGLVQRFWKRVIQALRKK